MLILSTYFKLEQPRYKKWYRREPNNARRGRLDEDCVHMYGSGRAAKYWNDLWCTDKLGYVCEFKRSKNISRIYNSYNCYIYWAI